ncbi:hypothetical protein DUNSADRAFT_14890 [Dunaliella salina]|uniref:RING-Gid-type domain-containing protein n=1 Tax=Dunaliella salina TaxID=3046 RepID=A0ABQ7G6J2_DUNSA|nr:hypothetical protein DUNSADRAFT_14890 [Dunaliella salina]|eukprot:KAF5830228.1 hypothetical protein DUNSADRAFT_14890 [Dunaliella salina]
MQPCTYSEFCSQEDLVNPSQSLQPSHLLAILQPRRPPAPFTPLATLAHFLQSCSREDPLHLPSFQALSKDLPYSKHVHSKLLCSVTRTMLSDANPPVVLPNGYVYSQQAVDMISEQHNGRMVCPKTGSSYALDELRRAFIV